MDNHWRITQAGTLRPGDRVKLGPDVAIVLRGPHRTEGDQSAYVEYDLVDLDGTRYTRTLHRSEKIRTQP